MRGIPRMKGKKDYDHAPFRRYASASIEAGLCESLHDPRIYISETRETRFIHRGQHERR